MPLGVGDIAQRLSPENRNQFMELVRLAEQSEDPLPHEMDDSKADEIGIFDEELTLDGSSVDANVFASHDPLDLTTEEVTLRGDVPDDTEDWDNPTKNDHLIDSVDLEVSMPDFRPERPPDMNRGPSWQIGNYIVKSKISSGGQGTVFLAFQPHTERKVALKLLRQGSMPTVEYMSRFRTEYRTLGLMNHQNIARIFEAGTTSNGTPFFSMEYVDGGLITEYCRTRHLSLRKRMALFLQVCEGVLHAHQRLILHRDIKPANILISDDDKGPVVKIVDFGIAKGLNSEILSDNITQGLLGTPAYIAPEFLGANKPEPDTRTDIYALGVVLYELLTNSSHLRLPKNIAVDDQWRFLREAEPERPSKHLCDDCRKGNRKLDMKDLDAIVLRAMARVPERRYATVAALIDDCSAFLGGRAVTATQPSPFYLMRKFITRYKVWVTSSGLILLALCGGFISTYMARRDAEKASSRFQSSYEALADVFSAADPYKMGRDARVFDVLRNRELQFDESFSKDPILEAKIRGLWGKTYLSLGVYEKARDHLLRAHQLQEQLGVARAEQVATQCLLAKCMSRLGENEVASNDLQDLYYNLDFSTDSIELKMTVLTELANVLHQQNQNDRAEILLLEASNHVSKVSDDATRASYLSSLATIYHSLNKEEAEGLYREATALWSKSGVNTDVKGKHQTMNNFANHLRSRGKFQEAEQLYLELISAREARLGTKHHLTLLTWSGLGLCYRNQGRFDKAEIVFSRVLEGMNLLGEDFPDTLNTMRRLASAMLGNNKQEQSAAILEQLMARYKRNGLEQTADALKTAGNLGDMRVHQGAFEEARVIMTRTLDLMQQVYREESPNILAARMTLGQALEGLARFQEADAQYLEVIQLLEKNQPQSSSLHYYRAFHGHNLSLRKQYTEAEEILLESYNAQKAGSPAAVEIRRFLHQHYTARGLSDEAALYQE